MVYRPPGGLTHEQRKRIREAQNDKRRSELMGKESGYRSLEVSLKNLARHEKTRKERGDRERSETTV